MAMAITMVVQTETTLSILPDRSIGAELHPGILAIDVCTCSSLGDNPNSKFPRFKFNYGFISMLFLCNSYWFSAAFPLEFPIFPPFTGDFPMARSHGASGAKRSLRIEVGRPPWGGAALQRLREAHGAAVGRIKGQGVRGPWRYPIVTWYPSSCWKVRLIDIHIDMFIIQLLEN